MRAGQLQHLGATVVALPRTQAYILAVIEHAIRRIRIVGVTLLQPPGAARGDLTLRIIRR